MDADFLSDVICTRSIPARHTPLIGQYAQIGPNPLQQVPTSLRKVIFRALYTAWESRSRMIAHGRASGNTATLFSKFKPTHQWLVSLSCNSDKITRLQSAILKTPEAVARDAVIDGCVQAINNQAHRNRMRNLLQHEIAPFTQYGVNVNHVVGTVPQSLVMTSVFPVLLLIV